MAFMVGLIAGVWAFTEVYVAIAGFVWSSDMGPVTFSDLLGVPFWVVAALLMAMALAVFWFVTWFERRRAGASA